MAASAAWTGVPSAFGARSSTAADHERCQTTGLAQRTIRHYKLVLCGLRRVTEVREQGFGPSAASTGKVNSGFYGTNARIGVLERTTSHSNTWQDLKVQGKR